MSQNEKGKQTNKQTKKRQAQVDPQPPHWRSLGKDSATELHLQFLTGGLCENVLLLASPHWGNLDKSSTTKPCLWSRMGLFSVPHICLDTFVLLGGHPSTLSQIPQEWTIYNSRSCLSRSCFACRFSFTFLKSPLVQGWACATG